MARQLRFGVSRPYSPPSHHMDIPTERRGLLLMLAASAASILLYLFGIALGHLGFGALRTGPFLLAIILLTGFLGAREWSWLRGTLAAATIGLLQLGLSYLVFWALAPKTAESSGGSALLHWISFGLLLAYTLLGAVGATFARVLGPHPTPLKAMFVSITWLIGFGLLRWFSVRWNLDSLLGPTPKAVTLLHDWAVYVWWIAPPLGVLVWATQFEPGPPPGSPAG